MEAIRKLYGGMSKFSDYAQKALHVILAFLMVSCAAALFFQVIYRFIIIKFVSFSFPFTEEYARYALIWSTYLSVGLCFKEGTMASVNILYDRLKGRPKLALYLFTRIFIFIFLIIGIKYGMRAVANNAIFKSPTLRLPGIYLYSAPLVGCILMVYEVFTEMVGVVSGVLEPFVGRKEEFATEKF